MAALSDVELVEAGTEATAVARHRRWPYAALAVVAVVGLLLGGQSVLDARERAHLTRFDDVPGVLAPLASQLHVLWSQKVVDGNNPLDDAVDVHGHVVVASVAHNRYRIREIDRATGRDDWVTTGDATFPADLPDGRADCVPVGAGDQVACAFEPGGASDLPGGPLIVVVDAADGSVLSSRSGSFEAWTAAGGAVVTATSSTAGASVTWTLDARDGTGAQLWRRTLGPVAAAPQYPDNAHFDQTLLQAAGHRVMLTDAGATWSLDGGVVTSEGRLPRDTRTELVNGVLVSTAWKVTANGDSDFQQALPGVTLQALSGATFRDDGTVAYPAVDDGSAADLVLLHEPDGTLTARDTRSGRVRWVLHDAWGDPLVLGGTVYTVTGDSTLTLVAVDASTGETRWHDRLVDPLGGSGLGSTLMTDGRALYVRGASYLLPFSIDDGTERPVRALPPELLEDTGTSDDTRAGVLAFTRYDEESMPFIVTAVG